MKKLMIALVAVAMGFCAQAASINWFFSWATDASGADVTAGSKAYLMAVSAMSVADASAAFDAGTFDTSTALDVGTIAVNSAKGAYVSQSVASSLEGSQTFYAILVNGDQYAITDTVAATMKTIGDTVVAFYELSLEDGTSTIAWNKIGTAVPEPTSGLLMLVGLAGLALRRKRA
jgi:hypothetical protein